MAEQVVIDTSGETAGPTLEEQAAAMDANQETQEEVSSDRPEWLPEKFKSPEDLAKAYSELEQRMSAPQEDQPQEQEVREELDNAGVDYDALSQEFWQNGDLSDESYDALEKAGIPRSIVDSYIDAQMAMVENQRSAIMGEVGGPDGYAELTAWAADNLDQSEIDYYNKVIDGNDFDAIRMVVRSVAARRDASEGVEPSRNLSGSVTGGTGGVYESVSQLMSDMQSKQYETDPAFRAQVEAKLARSNIL
ncbi:scaffolding protein [Roseobacter phage CRP-804]|uniref:Scaffolding protein n=1 Tax=Roseobacter phage CRP-804 TaxID=3072850 RepID=A0AAX3ZVY6_9CAUD|nr:scaffolding protein [Roseobacter phage CRP-804]